MCSCTGGVRIDWYDELQVSRDEAYELDRFRSSLHTPTLLDTLAFYEGVLQLLPLLLLLSVV